MASTSDLRLLDDRDDAASVLAHARAQRQVEEDAARQVLQAAARWAAMHSGDSLVGPVDGWHESALPLGGEGCPEVAEFAVVELAAALGRSTESGRRYLAHAVEGAYRLPRCWARLVAGDLPAWRLGMVAERTIPLSPAAAAFVDAHVAPVAHKIGPTQLLRLVDEAIARFDPGLAEARRQAAAETRRFDVRLSDTTVTGTVHVDGEVDLADALDLETAVAAGAEERRRLGSTEPLDVRRAQAVGDLARAQQPLELPEADRPGTPESRRPRRPRPVVLHVHLSDAALRGTGELARVDGLPGPVTAEQVRLWCGDPDARVTVKPVIDLAEHLHVGAYEAGERLKEQLALRDLVCAFPHCDRPAVRADCDHRVPHADDGPTCSCNLVPACRTHHRAKTTGGWTYQILEPGTYLWRSPHGYSYLKDHQGTLDVTPTPERRRLARRFQAHLGAPAPSPKPIDAAEP